MTKRARCQPLITGLWEPSLGSCPAPPVSPARKRGRTYPGSDNHYTQAKPPPKRLPKFVIRYKELFTLYRKNIFSFSVAPNVHASSKRIVRGKNRPRYGSASLFTSSDAYDCKYRTIYPFTQMQKVRKEPRRALFLVANRFRSEEVDPGQAGDEERSRNRQDGVQLGESGQNQRFTHHVVAVADGSDAVGADFRLIDGGGQID